MAPDGAGGRAWRIKQYGVKPVCGLEVHGIGHDAGGGKTGARQVLMYQVKPGFRNVECRYAGARGDKLQGLATRGGTHVQHGLATHLAQQAGRQCGSGILHPPAALLETWQGGNGWVGHGKPDRASGKTDATGILELLPERLVLQTQI